MLWLWLWFTETRKSCTTALCMIAMNDGPTTELGLISQLNSNLYKQTLFWGSVVYVYCVLKVRFFSDVIQCWVENFPNFGNNMFSFSSSVASAPRVWARKWGQYFFSCGAAAQRGPRPPHFWGSLITHNDSSQSVGLLWTSDQFVAETSTWQHTTLHNRPNIHVPGGIRTHDLSRRAAADLRLRPRGQWDRLNESKGLDKNRPQFFTGLNVVTSKQAWIFTSAVVRTWNLALRFNKTVWHEDKGDLPKRIVNTHLSGRNQSKVISL